MFGTGYTVSLQLIAKHILSAPLNEVVLFMESCIWIKNNLSGFTHAKPCSVSAYMTKELEVISPYMNGV